jgi:cytochrome c5
MRLTLLLIAPIVALGLLPAPVIESPARAAADDEEKSIQLPSIPGDLPEAKGLTTVNAACVICHSTRYISMQPQLPRKTWAATVDKMRKTFGAPMSDEQAAEVVEYLVTIKGAQERLGK